MSLHSQDVTRQNALFSCAGACKQSRCDKCPPWAQEALCARRSTLTGLAPGNLPISQVCFGWGSCVDQKGGTASAAFVPRDFLVDYQKVMAWTISFSRLNRRCSVCLPYA